VRVVLTRAAGGNDELAARLSGDAEAVECPLVRIERLDGPRVPTDRYDWLVLTSGHGVEALFARGFEGGLPPVAAIGPGTAGALGRHGVEPALVPEVSTQEGLVAAFPESPGRVLFAGAEGARDVIARELGADFLPLYRTVELRPEAFPDADLVVLASASAARAFAGLGRNLPCVSIGPVTTAAARERGLEIVAEAASHDLDGLVEAVRLAASRTASSPS
jgi:uroporphyrinogen III methyltransferase/synthase